MESSVEAVERLLSYKFNNKELLQEALTHSSYAGTVSYERLEFIGDSAIGLAISNYFFLLYPDLHEGQLSLLRAANISTEKLARVAVRHGLYNYVRRNSAALDNKVRYFVDSLALEDDSVPYGGLVKAPKVLADIVESVAGAVYADVDFDLKKLWVIIRGLLEPIYTLKDVQVEPQPVTLLFQVCQRHGKQVDIKNWKNGSKSIVSVYVDGDFVASGSSTHKEIARLNAAREALNKLSGSMDIEVRTVPTIDGINESFEIEGAKHKLHDFCCKKKWSKPIYSTEKDLGPSHDKRFVCSVKISFTSSSGLYMEGDEKLRVRDAENSAASLMIRALQERNVL